MTAHRLYAPDIDFAAVRAALELPNGYPAEALEEARRAADRLAADRVDHTDIPFVTIDPASSMDLDQAIHVVRDGANFVLQYAIADVAALVLPNGALDAESRRRGQTMYLPDGNIPLHPRELSEGVGSLLPDQVRPAVLWRIVIDSDGAVQDVDVTRSMVKSVAKLNYSGVQADADAGRPHPSIAALPDFGELRAQVAIDRGAIELRLPAQDVVRDDGGWRLIVEPRTPADIWNSQASLLTGMCAGKIMRDSKVGLLRTLPPVTDGAVDKLRASARALGIDWPAGTSASKILAGLDPAKPQTLALMSDATALLRGADYLAMDGTIPADAVTEHGGIAGVYAHVTAPLRRLADRFATECCLALCAGQPVPDWVTAALPELPKLMRASDSLANKAERQCIDLAEATLLHDQVGQQFPAVVLHERRGEKPAQVFVEEPAVIADCAGDPAEGSAVTVTLSEVTMDPPRVSFSA
ncbi:RNB domain-containing ribonuclease [Jongsikchunia kroppenstedtii]|uniref:RNB domain-containing ribonuclease n=1 Tax=Jongsikchunia kroppenstedtii TaxID=1121721 RepID=UPI000380FCC4|nr:RNB domain-containing ribonuclease [Jongsikchunia kroppenstedtii]